MKRIKLKQFRVGEQLTQQEMADKLGIAKITYYSIENGLRAGSEQFWLGLQAAFDIPDSEMFALMKAVGKP